MAPEGGVGSRIWLDARPDGLTAGKGNFGDWVEISRQWALLIGKNRQ